MFVINTDKFPWNFKENKNWKLRACYRAWWKAHVIRVFIHHACGSREVVCFLSAELIWLVTKSHGVFPFCSLPGTQKAFFHPSCLTFELSNYNCSSVDRAILTTTSLLVSFAISLCMGMLQRALYPRALRVPAQSFLCFHFAVCLHNAADIVLWPKATIGFLPGCMVVLCGCLISEAIR